MLYEFNTIQKSNVYILHVEMYSKFQMVTHHFAWLVGVSQSQMGDTTVLGYPAIVPAGERGIYVLGYPHHAVLPIPPA